MCELTTCTLPATAIANRGVAQKTMGNDHGASKSFDKAKAINPDHVQIGERTNIYSEW
jgi:hypothetical protein